LLHFLPLSRESKKKTVAAMEAHEAPPPAAAAAPLQQAPNLPPPRLIISEMVLENFKSYAGEQRVGPFHKVCVLAFFLSNARRMLRREKKRFHKLARANATSNARAFGGSIPQGDRIRNARYTRGLVLMVWEPGEAANEGLESSRRRPRRSLASVSLSTQQSTFLSQSFSSVVGPNGSGKSNVIDALLFVFGKRAKQVRGREVEKERKRETEEFVVVARAMALAFLLLRFQRPLDLLLSLPLSL